MKVAAGVFSVMCIATGVNAQSSTTVFGIIDVGLTRGSGAIADRTQMNSGNSQSARIGFRGTEDIGGGLRASYWLEAQINVDSGLGVATNSNNQTTGTSAGASALNFNRRSTVSLHGNWGEIRLGRDFTSHYLNRSAADVFGVVGVGASQPHVGTLGGPIATRASNMIAYHFPSNLGGLYGQAQVFLGENASNVANEDDGRGYSVRLGYATGSVNLSAALGDTRYVAGNIQSLSVLGLYDFGAVKFSAAYLRDRNDAPAAFTGKGHTLGLIVPVGQHEIKVSHSRYGSSAGAKPTTSKLALGYVHNLSKRSALYATVARVRNSGGAATALGGAVTTANGSSSGFDFGVRHSF